MTDSGKPDSTEPDPTDRDSTQSSGPTPTQGPLPSAGSPADSPTGEVVTGPIDPSRRPAAKVPPQGQSRPVTRQMDALGTGGFDPSSSPGIPVASSPAIPVTRSAPAGDKRGRRRTIALISAAVVLLLVIAGVGSELYMRSKVTDCISNAFGNLTGASTDVSVSRKPMLLSIFGSEVSWVQVDTNDGDAGNMRLHARAEGISTDGGTVRSLKGSGSLPYKRITELSSENDKSGVTTITSITGDANAGTFTLNVDVPVAIITVPATVTLKPVTTGGSVKFEVTEAKALMFGLPNDYAQPIVDQVTSSMFGQLFKQIKVSDLKVTATGIDFAFSGSDVNLKAASEGQTGNSSGNCSV
ncbi:hypothetical protein nbrc107696_17320 [Gordonia spumicola]|uniref:DUF2993 domain-containing protein n=1 Tax=Gordonia spumicola TaxID=589161 RepID=A0A7I9V7B6_9ACTN|nr:LmeA family phospholipid-binding protein [Gordonia spumicola]GEE01286.1 hypothetical protein nbrc107696_17320 [Gordonia spumicola]